MSNWDAKSANKRQLRDAVLPDRLQDDSSLSDMGIPISEQKQDVAELTLRDLSRQQAFDSYLSAQIGMSFHPGTTRDAAKPRTLAEMVTFAKQALAARDALFND